MTFYIKVDNNRLSEVKFKTFGCGAAIAVSSIVSEIAKELGGLPKNKLHCSNLGAGALHKAIKNYQKKLENKRK